MVEYGFAKYSPPAGLRVPSRYELSMPGDFRLALWGFGLYIGDAGQDGLWLGRLKLTPRLMASPGAIWEPGALPDVSASSTRGEWERVHVLLIPALLWIAEYERWVISTYGAAYRQECLDAWHRSVCRGDETAPRWRRFAGLASRSWRWPLEPAPAGANQALSAAGVSPLAREPRTEHPNGGEFHD